MQGKQIFQQSKLHHLHFENAAKMMSVAADNVRKQVHRDYNDDVNRQLDEFKQKGPER